MGSCLLWLHFTIQCDERPNSCGACIKRRTRCSFKSPTPSALSPAPSLLDLELLHNFSTKTRLSMTTYAPLQEFYSTDFISKALKTDYVLHSLLSISAYHLAQQYQETLRIADEQPRLTDCSNIKGYLVAAHRHHKAGLNIFKQTLTNITSENCHALFACSALIAMTTFARSCDSLRLTNESLLISEADQESEITVIELLLQVRCIKTVLVEAQQWIQVGPMSPMLHIRGTERYEKTIGRVDEKIAVYLDSLSATVMQYSDSSVSDVCVTAIKLLRKSFAGMAYRCEPSVVFFWLVLVPSEFMTLLELNMPEALTVFASFCVLLHSLDGRWLFKGWSLNMLRIIERKLDKKWRRWLWLPSQIIRKEGSRELNGPSLT